MRTKNSFINLIVSWSTQIINILLQFILRTVFINILTTEYLGLNGLFSNILSCLSFAELGFGAAITFSLYKPLAENDEKTIAGIMNFFKKVYFAVGLFVLVAGLSLVPFITKLINDIPDIKYIHLIYALWVLNSGISYFLVYKSTLIIADQRKDIVEKNNFVFKIIQLVLQVIILILTRNYVFYLLVQIFVTIVTNISISVIADKRYPFLIRKRNEKINLDILSEIKKNVCATVLHKIGAVVIFGTDNLINDVQNLYLQEFENARIEYNNKQTREDRKIQNYFEHISKNSNRDLCCELIIELGDMNFWQDKTQEYCYKMVQVYKEQLQDFVTIVPQFKIANAVIHFDETSPHLHIIGIPIKERIQKWNEKTSSKITNIYKRIFNKDTRQNEKLLYKVI